MVKGTTVGCKGNGKTIGVYSNGAYGGMGNSTAGATAVWEYLYDKGVSTTSSGSAWSNNRSMGLTGYTSKSGIVADLSELPTLNWAIKY